MKQEIVEILTKLISCHTTNDNPSAITDCYNYIDSQLTFFPFFKKTFIQNGVESRIWSTVDTLTPEYILNAHIDVVPAPEEMFKLKVKGNIILGRGVSDMKYSIAVFICVLKEIFQSKNNLPSLAIMLTADEEHGGNNGVGYLVNQLGYHPKLAFVPDGGENNKIVENAKGIIHLQINSKGKPAHAARLWEGEGAIEKLAVAVNNLRKIYPYPSEPIWVNTLNIGKISGGIQTNQVPDSASMSVDLRYIPGTNLVEELKKIKTACRDCQITTIISGDAFKIDRHNEYLKRWAKLISSDNSVFINEHIASDGRYFSILGIPTIVTKPVGGYIHHPDEWSDLKSIVEFSNHLKQFLQNEIR